MGLDEQHLREALALAPVFTPIINGSAPGADTPILGSGGVTPETHEIWAVTATFLNATVLNVTQDDGTTSRTIGLNKSVPMGALDKHTFVFGVSPENAYDFEIETDGAIIELIVLRSRSGASF